MSLSFPNSGRLAQCGADLQVCAGSPEPALHATSELDPRQKSPTWTSDAGLESCPTTKDLIRIGKPSDIGNPIRHDFLGQDRVSLPTGESRVAGDARPSAE